VRQEAYEDVEEYRIDLDLHLNLHGRVEISRLMLRHHPEMVRELLLKKLTHQFKEAMREEVAKSMGAETIKPDDLGRLRDLLEEGLRRGFMDGDDKFREAYGILRRLAI
jgi:hypothetical protein